MRTASGPVMSILFVRGFPNKISILRKLNCILNRHSLRKIYTTFIRFIIEYGCEVWNGCGVELNDKLEKLQLEAAMIVTGLPA